MKSFHVTGIGNAIVDVLARVEDGFLTENGVEKGIMQLIDAGRALTLYDRMGPATEVSGGSAANTIAGLGMLGARASYVGKVRDDQLGRIFAHDIRSLGVSFDTPMKPNALEGEETGRCMVLVTPDGERSMNTYLGVSADLGPDDVNEAAASDSEWIYLEGYRFDGFESQEAFRKAIAACKGAGGRISITLSDPFCIERHRDLFRDMVREDIDLLFANEHELVALYQTDTLEAAIEAARAEVAMTACTIGPKGVHIATEAEVLTVPAAPMPRVDATGAGDLFAAGFLYGLTHGRDLESCGRMGCLAAGEIIGHIGARPEQDLRALFRADGLL
ncbi:adenosine kinase [Rubrimonas cliftonensis]|uniref:Sugar or nucleoside kinase, ribokinase family n=1 Tax=Rubrimonas cliftonensis TaxID=89524 RepID=A0A1H4D489_9RHOB|nr:adenosine kinase [Rubrimonas cliftonensis]SEA67565.1 Sugar or nucleoside kinase, ribokinase family [Rubrimonas cliftonensis]